MNDKIFQVFFYLLKLAHPKLSALTARYVLAQAKLESANWTSPLYLSTNNMFGMQQPAARQTASLGASGKGYATFRSPLDSIRDQLLYAEAFELYTDDLYHTRIATKYAADKAYVGKIDKIAAALGPALVSPNTFLISTVVLLAGALAAAWAAVSTVKKLTT